jgi:peptide deformylase
MIRDIVKCGHPALRAKGQRIERITPALRQLTTDMFDTMYAAEGVGLAAQQVGQAVMLAVVDVSRSDLPSSLAWNGEPADVAAHMPLVLVNPVLTRSEGRQAGPEGCLSVPEVTADIVRAERVEVQFQDLTGQPQRIAATGLLSRALQHELDHLNGILFLDRMDPATRAGFSDQIQRLQQQSAAQLQPVTRRARVGALR